MRRIAFFILSVMLCSAVGYSVDSLTIEGSVIDKVTGQPIECKIMFCDQIGEELVSRKQSCYTEDGKFSLFLYLRPDKSAGHYAIYVSSVSEEIHPYSGQPVPVNSGMYVSRYIPVEIPDSSHTLVLPPIELERVVYSDMTWPYKLSGKQRSGSLFVDDQPFKIEGKVFAQNTKKHWVFECVLCEQNGNEVVVTPYSCIADSENFTLNLPGRPRKGNYALRVMSVRNYIDPLSGEPTVIGSLMFVTKYVPVEIPDSGNVVKIPDIEMDRVVTELTEWPYPLPEKLIRMEREDMEFNNSIAL